MAAVILVRAGMSSFATTEGTPPAAAVLDEPLSPPLLAALNTRTAPRSPRTSAMMMSFLLLPLAGAAVIDLFILASPPGRSAPSRAPGVHAYTQVSCRLYGRAKQGYVARKWKYVRGRHPRR